MPNKLLYLIAILCILGAIDGSKTMENARKSIDEQKHQKRDDLFTDAVHLQRRRTKAQTKVAEHDFMRGKSPDYHNLKDKMTFFGAMIMSNQISNSLEFVKHSLPRQVEDDPDGKTKTAESAIAVRTQHARELQKELPFPVAEWPGVFTTRCPQKVNQLQHKTERGVAMAHYQIWHDFQYFDPMILNATEHQDNQSEFYQPLSKIIPLLPSWVDNEIKLAVLQNENFKAWTSEDGTFIGMYKDNGNGKGKGEIMLFKNAVRYRDTDVITILEDDADISTSNNITDVLYEEISYHILEKKKDALWLGWCEGRKAWPVPLCLHSYVLSRRGARIASANFEICGLAVDEQLVKMCKNNLLQYDRARTFSYRPSNKNYPQPKDNTKGIFHQKRMGSFNGHTGYKLDNFESYTRKYFKKWYKDGDKVSIDPNSAT
jgi:hypothetical protein